MWIRCLVTAWHNSTLKNVSCSTIRDATSQPQTKPLQTQSPIQSFVYTEKDTEDKARHPRKPVRTKTNPRSQSLTVPRSGACSPGRAVNMRRSEKQERWGNMLQDKEWGQNPKEKNKQQTQPRYCSQNPRVGCHREERMHGTESSREPSVSTESTGARSRM